MSAISSPGGSYRVWTVDFTGNLKPEGMRIDQILSQWAVNPRMVISIRYQIAGTPEILRHVLTHSPGIDPVEIDAIMATTISLSNFTDPRIWPMVTAEMNRIFARISLGSPTTLSNVKVAYIRPLGYPNLKAWCADPRNVYIGRRGCVFIDGMRYPPHDSKWANPFKVETYGIEAAMSKYAAYIRNQPWIHEIEELRGKNLGCWCVKPGESIPCHGQILISILAERF